MLEAPPSSSSRLNKESEPSKYCHGCNEPPYKNKNGESIKMLRCSRCGAAWYHDIQCQRKHYKIHKQQCRLVPQNGTFSECSKVSNCGESSLYRCEHLESHGRSMVATTMISQGTLIKPSYQLLTCSDDPPKFFEAIVPPVLLKSERGSRCAHCFRKIDTFTRPDDMNIFQYCSLKCQTRGSKFDGKLLMLATSKSAHKQNIHQLLTPITLLLYKIICAIQLEETLPDHHELQETTKSQMNQLVSNDDSHGFPLSVEENQYRHIIANSCFKVYKDINNTDNVPLTIDEMVEFTSKIIYNSFSITDGEQKSIGLGLYPKAAIINHSCTPNLVQTFAYGCGHSNSPTFETPKLVLTASKNIEKGQEMFIAYTDPLEIFSKRDAYCMEEYKFQCDCARCAKSRLRRSQVSKTEDKDDYDSISEMLKCPTKGCRGFCYDYDLSEDCKLCSRKDQMHSFARVRQLRDNATIVVNSLSQKISMLDSISHEEIRTAKDAYCNMKKYCHSSSWYVQESGKLLADMLLNHLHQLNNDVGEISKICNEALGLLEELNRNSMEQSLNPISNVHNQLKIAKLLLYLNPDPRRAIAIIQRVQAKLVMYFPLGHEILCLAEETLQTAYQ